MRPGVAVNRKLSLILLVVVFVAAGGDLPLDLATPVSSDGDQQFSERVP